MAGRLSDLRPPETRLRRRRFYGDDPDEFLEWSRHMSYYFRQRDYDQFGQGDIAIGCLADYAWDWWCRVVDDRWRRGFVPVETWEQLVYVMTRRFAPRIDPVAYAARCRQRTSPARSLVKPTITARSPARIPARLPECVPARAPDPVLIAAAKVPEFIAAPNEPEFIVAPTEPVFIVAPTKPVVIVAPPAPEIIAMPTSLEFIAEQQIDTAPAKVTFDTPPTELTVIATPAEDAVITVIPEQVSMGSCYLLFAEESDDAPSPGPEFYLIHFEIPRVAPSPDVVYLAPPTSKRGRFDSKGRRMMWSWLAMRGSTTSPSQPRPWRPPWSMT